MTINIESLSLRLIRIRNFVTGRRVADIGCDHGKLVYDMFERGLIDYAFVSDISEPSVNKAVKLLSSAGYPFDYAVADGLDAVKPEYDIDEVVISGMGGLEIIKILQNNRLNLDRFVLQPQNNELKLKQYLLKNGYNIVRDEIVRDKHMFYNVIKVVKTGKRQKLTPFELRFGKDNFGSNMDFIAYLDFLKLKYESMLPMVPPLKKAEVSRELKYIDLAYKKWGKRYEKNITVSKN